MPLIEIPQSCSAKLLSRLTLGGCCASGSRHCPMLYPRRSRRHSPAGAASRPDALGVSHRGNVSPGAPTNVEHPPRFAGLSASPALSSWAIAASTNSSSTLISTQSRPTANSTLWWPILPPAIALTGLLLPLKGPGHSSPRGVRTLRPYLPTLSFPPTSPSSRHRNAVVLVYDRIGDHLVGNNVCIPGNPDWSL